MHDPDTNPLRRFSSRRTKLLAARCECLHLIKINCLALWLDESAHACTRSELRDTPDAIRQRDAIFRFSLTDNFDPSLNFPNI
jgi:hypothetical protein